MRVVVIGFGYSIDGAYSSCLLGCVSFGVEPPEIFRDVIFVGVGRHHTKALFCFLLTDDSSSAAFYLFIFMSCHVLCCAMLCCALLFFNLVFSRATSPARR